MWKKKNESAQDCTFAMIITALTGLCLWRGEERPEAGERKIAVVSRAGDGQVAVTALHT